MINFYAYLTYLLRYKFSLGIFCLFSSRSGIYKKPTSPKVTKGLFFLDGAKVMYLKEL
jgi:hypothetical protein